jgi:succinate dehydrogenase/fumarate reductase flavoprotein subunit
MASEKVKLCGFEIDCYSINTLIIGSGAASLNAANSLDSMGQKDFLVVTEKWGGGTSNNAGSDKQTYYKLSLAGEEPDSAIVMANDLFSGHCMHGDIALCEAQGSVRAFMNLVNLGVPFPQNKFGAWVGYKTDHDPRARATSAGPYTSRMMFEKLSSEVRKRKIKVIDRVQIISLLTAVEGENKKVTGALGIKLTEKDLKKAFVIFNSVNIVFGTGGPGGIYESSVYPHSQAGSSGIAFEAGATGQNLTESQFGLASIKFRWNLSGSYQQVIPRYISTDKKGNDEREFLNDHFPDFRTLTRAIFLKGYQWPFDPRKIKDYGSSAIDMLVYREMNEKNRRVFLDFRSNPSGPRGEKFLSELLDDEVRVYLEKSDSLGDTPFRRLESMNKPAIDLYLDHNINLETEPVEIAVCAQHNNGGLKGNIWWESNLLHLFPVGEANGSHGVYRPGGAALNSGQVGSSRAALFIAKKYRDDPPSMQDLLKYSGDEIEKKISLAGRWMGNGDKVRPSELIGEIRSRMSDSGGIIRDREKVLKAVGGAKKMEETIRDRIGVINVGEVASGFRAIDHCLSHLVYLSAILKYLEEGGRSRGSFVVPGQTLCEWDREIENDILEVNYNKGRVIFNLAAVRPVPEQELWFEKVWRKNLEDNLTDC